MYHFCDLDKGNRYLAEALDKLPIKISKSKKNPNISHWLGFKPVTYRLNLLIFLTNLLQAYYIAKESLMKIIFCQVSIQQIFSQIFGDLSNKINRICFINVVDRNFFQINNHKDVKFFNQNLVYIALEAH